MSPVAVEVEQLFDLDLQVIELDTRTVYGAETRSQTCNGSCPGNPTCGESCGGTCLPQCSGQSFCTGCR